jgi:hypothetical protein
VDGIINKSVYSLIRECYLTMTTKNVLISLCIFLVGCIFAPEIDSSPIDDGGFLSHNPCGPPCFFGITVGITSEMEADQILISNKNIFTNCEIRDNTSSGGGRGVNCDQNIGISYDNKIVEGIGFSPSVNITIQQVIDLYNSPDLVNTFVVSLPDEAFKSRMILYYDQLQVVLGLAEQDGTQYTIDSADVISNIAYYSDDMYLTLRSLAESNGVPWNGFDTYTSTLP